MNQHQTAAKIMESEAAFQRAKAALEIARGKDSGAMFAALADQSSALFDIRDAALELAQNITSHLERS